MAELQTADQVIDALGGTSATARLTGRKAQHVSNWRAEGRLPPDTYLIVLKELKRKRKSAPPTLFSIQAPEAAE